jgi:exodeoxyribonuclease-3
MLRVLSYNIQRGGEDRLPAIERVIRAQQPDVAALLEANSRPHARALAAALGMALAFGAATSAYHVAWLSRLPILRARNHPRPVFHKTLLEIEVSWEGAPLRLFAAHLAAGREADDAELERRRAAEVAAILDVLRPLAGLPHLLAGDFNALHPDDAIAVDRLSGARLERARRIADLPRLAIPQLLAAGYVDGYRALHAASPGHTYEASNPFVRLDYLFASPELAPRLRSCDVVAGDEAAAASDHLPVRAEVD